jgi:hypothetical protein
MNLKNEKIRSTACIMIVLSVIVFSFIDCKSPESPEEIVASIYVSNECGLKIDVYMDGAYKFTLEFLYYEIIENVSPGTYEIVAKKEGTGEVIVTEIVTITTSGETWVSILYSASINVVNQYGEPLNIYTNGNLQGELGDGENQVFTKVPYGEHVIEASKASDNSFVASVTINVAEEKEYTWTIK